MVSNNMILDARGEKRKIELQILTPVHIGSKEGRLTALDFVWASRYVHIIDEQKFGRFLLERKLIDHFIQDVKKGPVNLERFLSERARCEIPKDLPKVSVRTIPGGDNQMQEFRPFIRDGKGTIFIPGTSLKGVFRTAILYKKVKSDNDLRRKIESQIDREAEQDLGKKRRFYSETVLQKQQMQDFQLPGAKRGPNQDLLRCITVRDAYPSGELATEIIRIHFLSKSKDNNFYWSQDKRNSGRDLVIWVEAVTGGIFETEIIWDQKLFEVFKNHNKKIEFPVNSLEEIFKAVEDMNRDLIEEEIKFFSLDSGKKSQVAGYKEYLKDRASGAGAATSLRNWYENQKNKSNELLRVGFGSGMLSTTVDLILPHNLRQKIRDACGSGKRPGDPAPKSRRIWKKTDDEFLPMGWFKLV